MNANVFMEADKQTLALKAWPPEIRSNVFALDECKLDSLAAVLWWSWVD